MDLQKSKILLEKINSLHKSMSADARNISVIERDLMRKYIIQLYEIVLETTSSTKSAEDTTVEIIKSPPAITLRKQEMPAPKAEEPELVVKKAPIVEVQEENDFEEETIIKTEILMKTQVQLHPSVSEAVPAEAKAMNPELEDIFNLSFAK